MAQATAAVDAPPDDDQLRLAPGRRRIHVPALLGGVLLIVGCALAFGIVADRLSDRQPVLVLSQPVARGTVLTDADIAVTQVAVDAGVRVLPATERDRLVGRTLLTPLPAGALLSPELVGPGAIDLGAGTRTVGLALDPGEFPSSTLAPGDLVSVISTGGRGTVLDDRAAIIAVEPIIEGSAGLLVSVVVDTNTATAVAAAAAQDQVRLALRGDRP